MEMVVQYLVFKVVMDDGRSRESAIVVVERQISGWWSAPSTGGTSVAGAPKIEEADKRPFQGEIKNGRHFLFSGGQLDHFCMPLDNSLKQLHAKMVELPT